MKSRLVLATGNRHKLAELQAMVVQAGLVLDVRGQSEYGTPPVIDESASTFAGNAILKAQGIAAWLRDKGAAGDTLVLADDSGIEVDILNGAPGVYSARFAGLGASDDDNNRKLVEALRAAGVEASPACYRCVLALVRVDGEDLMPPYAPVDKGARHGTPSSEGGVLRFDGQWPVEVRTDARGRGGFGYDPHAWLAGTERTVAELEPDEKARLSHRGQATRALLAWLREHEA